MWSFRNPRVPLFGAAVLVILVAMTAYMSSTSYSSTEQAENALDAAMTKFIARPDAAPGIAVVVQRGVDIAFRSEGTAVAGRDQPITLGDHLRVASVSKAFTGATVLAVVASGQLSLNETIGDRLPDLPDAWAPVTLRELLHHTGGVPDFSQSEAFQTALVANLANPPEPETLLAFVADEPLDFRPGSEYHYSNADNIIAALMVEAATGNPYADEFQTRVLEPLELSETSLPTDSSIPAPAANGYGIDPPDPPEDLTNLFAAGWSWTSGGVVSTPADANRFVRAYVRGATTDGATRSEQLTFVPGHSEPAGPGTNAAGLSIFRYRTRCGTVFGHTGNTAGYTQFIAANATGTRSVSVSITAQITPNNNPTRFKELRRIYGLAVCAALA